MTLLSNPERRRGVHMIGRGGCPAWPLPAEGFGFLHNDKASSNRC